MRPREKAGRGVRAASLMFGVLEVFVTVRKMLYVVTWGAHKHMHLKLSFRKGYSH